MQIFIILCVINEFVRQYVQRSLTFASGVESDMFW